ncbi:MAG: thiopurine S-methyltransferase, partial [Bacteroidota bacterium]
RIAVEAFFNDNGLAPIITEHGDFTSYRVREIEILHGDFLHLTKADLNGATIVYDRAALVALPPEMRTTYADAHRDMLPSGSRILMITFEYPEGLRQGPPFSISFAEVERLYGDAFDIHVVIDIPPPAEQIEEAATMVERTYILTRR